MSSHPLVGRAIDCSLSYNALAFFGLQFGSRFRTMRRHIVPEDRAVDIGSVHAIDTHIELRPDRRKRPLNKA